MTAHGLENMTCKPTCKVLPLRRLNKEVFRMVVSDSRDADSLVIARMGCEGSIITLLEGDCEVTMHEVWVCNLEFFFLCLFF
jgi:hypothetical protein